MKGWFFLLALCLASQWEAGTASPHKAVVIMANGIDYDGAYGAFFEERGIRPLRVEADLFAEFRGYMNVLIIGGPDAPQTGEITQMALTAKDVVSLRRKGEGRLFMRENLWAEGQTVFIVAGYDREITSETVWRNLALIADSLRESLTVSPSGEILWMKEDLAGGIARAKVDERLVLVYIWTPWCSWCRKTEEEVFSDVRVREIIAQYYVPVRLNYDISKNAEYAHTQYAWGTPTFLIFDKEGKRAGILDGYQNAERFYGRLLKLAAHGNVIAQKVALKQPYQKGF